jgi:hypothetical protein
MMARILMVTGEVWPEAAATDVAPWREEFRQPLFKAIFTASP